MLLWASGGGSAKVDQRFTIYSIRKGGQRVDYKKPYHGATEEVIF